MEVRFVAAIRYLVLSLAIPVTHGYLPRSILTTAAVSNHSSDPPPPIPVRHDRPVFSVASVSTVLTMPIYCNQVEPQPEANPSNCYASIDTSERERVGVESFLFSLVSISHTYSDLCCLVRLSIDHRWCSDIAGRRPSEDFETARRWRQWRLVVCRATRWAWTTWLCTGQLYSSGVERQSIAHRDPILFLHSPLIGGVYSIQNKSCHTLKIVYLIAAALKTHVSPPPPPLLFALVKCSIRDREYSRWELATTERL